MTNVLAMFAGGGSLAALVAGAAVAKGVRVEVVVFEGQPRPDGLPEGVRVVEFNIAAVGKIVAHMKKAGVRRVVMAGHLVKPKLLGLRPDAKGLALLARVGGFGDDALLRAVSGVLGDEGFEVVPVTALLPELKAKAGVWGKVRPTAADEADIALGMEVLRAGGGGDRGQGGVVLEGGEVGGSVAWALIFFNISSFSLISTS